MPETPVDASTQRPKRRWFQFSLRTLLIAVTALAVWLGLKVDGANRQQRAVEAIEDQGGEFSYDYQQKPAVESLGLDNNPITDNGLVHIASLNKLLSLNLVGTQVTDEGLKCLEELSSLRVVHLRGTQVTFAGVERLQQALPQCKIGH